MNQTRLRIRPQSYLLVYGFIAALLLLLHQPLLGVAFYWDEIGQFIPASLDLYQTASWIPHSTLPNVHPPGVMVWLATFWHIFGFSIEATRIAMVLVAALAATFTFLLAIELGRGAPGAPAFTALSLLCVSPLFFSQAMLAQLDMPAMCCTLLALLLFLQNRFRASAIACIALVLVKETGIVAPALFAAWLVCERRAKEARWFAMPAAALVLWILVLKTGTGHWFGNRGFTDYNLFYPLHPLRLSVALLRRVYYLFLGGGHFIGTAVLLWALRRMPLLKQRCWRISGAFVGLHFLTVSALGGAVLERYLLPALPIVYIGFATSFRALLPRPRKWAVAALFACLVVGNFVNPIYPFPFENNLAFVTFVDLQKDAAAAIDLLPGSIATTFPMDNALQRPEYGYVFRGHKVVELNGFLERDILPLRAHPPQMMLVYDTAWDPLHLLDQPAVQSLLRQLYGYQRPMSPQEIGAVLSMREVKRWTRRGMWIELLVKDEKTKPLTLASR